MLLYSVRGFSLEELVFSEKLKRHLGTKSCGLQQELIYHFSAAALHLKNRTRKAWEKQSVICISHSSVKSSVMDIIN